jgi:hypothetical protein
MPGRRSGDDSLCALEPVKLVNSAKYGRDWRGFAQVHSGLAIGLLVGGRGVLKGYELLAAREGNWILERTLPRHGTDVSMTIPAWDRLGKNLAKTC